MSKRYTPQHVHQDDGSPCQWLQCWCAVGAWLVAGATRGRKTPTPTQFRRRAGIPCRTGGHYVQQAIFDLDHFRL